MRFFCETVQSKKGGGGKEGLKNVKSDEDEQYEAYHNVLDTAFDISRSRHKFPEDVAAEHYRIGREYNRQRFIQHNQMVKDLTLKMYLQQDALKALPPDLRELASVVDETPPPRNRPWPLWYTPPVPGLKLEDPDRDENEEQSIALEKGHYIKDKYTTDADKVGPDGSEREEDDDSDAEY